MPPPWKAPEYDKVTLEQLILQEAQRAPEQFQSCQFSALADPNKWKTYEIGGIVAASVWWSSLDTCAVLWI